MGLIFDNRIAKYYDTWYHSSQGRIIEQSLEGLLLRLVNPKPGERALDIGCGTGNHLILLNKMGLNVSGIDASSPMIKVAKKRLGYGCALKTGKAEDLPYDDNEFDVVFLIHTLEFLDEPLLALREAGRVAGRSVFIGVVNSLSWNGCLRKIQGYLGNPLFGRARFFSLWQIKSFIKAAYGHVPLSWDCIHMKAPSQPSDMHKKRKLDFMSLNHSPFGFFLGISATMTYRMKTDNLPLKLRLKEVGHSFIGAKPVKGMDSIKRKAKDERSLFI